ncbi:helix-turn-helix domain-containing protein [Paenibacillus sp. EC2-1]|uniref:helix-turn-helix domain-containing protein n=1 Tax=Paenibacillus sp. EC2-1 TaxID=3388665 RepID=UPI003BEEC581
MDIVKFGEYIRGKRKAMGYNLTQLSEESGVSHPYLSQIENGKLKKIPSAEILGKLAPHLGVSHTELLVQAGHLTSEQLDQLSEWENRIDNRPELKVSFMELQFQLWANYGDEFSKKMAPIIQALKTGYSDILGNNFKFNFNSLRDLENKALTADPKVRERIESFFIEILKATQATRDNLLLRGDLDYLINLPIANYKGINLSATDRKHIQSFLEGLFANRLHNNGE